jgi:hypothetical protein
VTEPEPETDRFSDDGVDRTQIREMLRLSPAERLQRLQDLVESILRVREANGFSSIP